MFNDIFFAFAKQNDESVRNKKITSVKIMFQCKQAGRQHKNRRRWRKASLLLLFGVFIDTVWTRRVVEPRREAKRIGREQNNNLKRRYLARNKRGSMCIMPTFTQMCRDFFLPESAKSAFAASKAFSFAIIGSASDLWHLSISLRPKTLTHRLQQQQQPLQRMFHTQLIH